MQLPLSSSSADPSLAALLFPSATSNSPLGGPSASPGGEPVVAGFEQLFAELQPATSAPIATAPKGAGPVAPVLPAPADPSALGNFPGTFRPSPAIEHPNVSGLASRVSARSGSASSAAKDPKEGDAPRIARPPSEPVNKSGPGDDSAAQAAVLAAIIPTPTESLPVAILSAPPLKSSIGAQTSEDLSAFVTSSAVFPLVIDEGRSNQAEETPPFDAAMTASRRAPLGFGSEPQGGIIAVASPEVNSGLARSASPRPEPKPVLADGVASIVNEDTPLAADSFGIARIFGGRGPVNHVPAAVTSEDGHARDIAPGRVFRNDSGTGANGLAIAEARSALNSSETERIKPRVDPSRGQQAKFAETDLVSRVDSKRFDNVADKTFLPAQPKDVAETVNSLGTAVANPHSPMVSFTNSAQPHAPSHHQGEIVTVVAEAGEIIEQTSLPKPTVSSAHEAVDTVLDAADRVASREQRSVDLDFTVGGAKLAVRVELQGGEVRTTFRTESSDLRVALAHEWEAVASGGEGRAFHLAPPTITGADTPARNDSFSDASSRQQERQQERESREALNVRDPAADGRNRAGQPAAGIPAPRMVPFPSGTSQHLHHFA